MVKRKPKPYIAPLVECPFCKEKMKAKELADHAKSRHANDPKFSKKTITFQPRLLEGVEVENADMVQSLNQLVVDESGMLVNPHMLEEEHRKSRDERMGTVPHPVPSNSKRKSKSNIAKPQVRSLKTNNDESFHNKVEWLDSLLENKKANADQSRFVKCPVCDMELMPIELSKHITKAHSHINLSKARTLQTIAKNLADRRSAKGQDKPGFIKKPNRVAVHQPEKKIYKQSSNVKCPLCQQMTQYNDLPVHIQVEHPEIDSKIVMTKFKRLYKNKDRSVQHRYEEEMNGLLQRYEKLKQKNDKP